MRRLRIDQARRAALAATGLHRPRPERVDVRHFRRTLAELDVVQLDSVNVITRAHELTFFSRLGAYDVDHLRRWLWLSREAFECWAHVASVMSVEAWPLLRHRQRENQHPWKPVQRLMDEQPGYVEDVQREVERHGPLSLADLTEAGERSQEHYWGWSPGKMALHWLFEAGRIAVHERTSTFAARYAGVGDVIPPDMLDEPDVPREEATERLLLRAVRAQAVGSAEDLADHHRLPIREARQAVDRLVGRGELVEVRVDGWDKPAYTHDDLAVPRTVRTRALVCPFDPLAWFRPRLKRLWDVDYTIEIYVPAAKRQYGYYVLPFLLDEAIVGRVDLKADRKSGRLLVRGAFDEDGADHDHVASELAAELRELAAWLQLGEVEVADNGPLAPALARHVG